MPKKLPRRLVALSASAVATVYFAGLLSTRAAADAVATDASSGVPAAPTATAATSPTSPVSVVVGATATPTATSVPASTPTATSTSVPGSKYADGNFSGTGSSRFGSVTVSLTTSGGKITNVQITKVTTSYPVSRIASLPAQVVQSQSATVNSVTGATYSSQAFKLAVQAALSQALATNSTGASTQ